MIRSMLEKSFCTYGRIEHTLKENLRQEKLVRQDTVRLYCFPFDTVWDYDSGMTVLLIQTDGQAQCYYLDRTITIFAGVCFGFYPLGEESVILADSVLLAQHVGQCDRPDSGAEIKPMEIFTRFRQTSLGGLYFRGERHEPLELVYVEKGELHNYCEGQELVLHPGEMLLFGADQWHMQYAPEDVQVVTISFRWEAHNLQEWVGQIFTATQPMLRCLDALVEPVNHGDAEEFYQANLKLLLIQIMQQPERAEKRKKALPVSELAHRKIVDCAMQTVSGCVFQKMTVPKLAAAVNVSTSQLTALFQTYLGISPARYITRIRLEESKKMLIEGHLSVGEVARRLGYSSVQHFSRQFHQWYDYTPTDFVKQQQL